MCRLLSGIFIHRGDLLGSLGFCREGELALKKVRCVNWRRALDIGLSWTETGYGPVYNR